MAILHEATREVICKIVYHGAGRCGKTTNLLYMHHQLPAGQRGRFVTLETPTERTLFFDFLPVMTEARGWKFRYLLFATPGQEYYDASRRLVLKGADAVVFVVDSQRERMEDNWQALELLKKNLKDLAQPVEGLPMVVQYNKRDLAQAMPVEDAERRYNPNRLLSFPAVARGGQGVYETFLTIAKMALTRLSRADGESRMGPLFRTLVIGEDDADRLGKYLDRVNAESGAAGSVLVDESTGVLASRGTVPFQDTESLGALLACNFTAAQELSANLNARGFSGVMQKGAVWLLRAFRVDPRRFLVMVCRRDADRRKVREAAAIVRAPLGEYLKQVDTVSANRLASFGELFASVTAIGVTGLTQP